MEKSSPLADQYSFPAQRPNIFPIGGLENIPAASAATDADRVAALRKIGGEPVRISFTERASAIQKTCHGAPVTSNFGIPVSGGFNFGQSHATGSQISGPQGATVLREKWFPLTPTPGKKIWSRR